MNERVKTLPADITSYDLLKAAAVVIMVIDHLGSYFFPDDLMLRAVGRIGFPVWFFLVGHASGRNIPLKLAGGALVLVAANFVTGMPLFPLNALVTIILIRLALDKMTAMAFATGQAQGADRPQDQGQNIWKLSSLLAFAIVPTYIAFEYGTLAFIFALFGYAVRHLRERDNGKFITRYMAFALVLFIVVQGVSYSFSQIEFVVMAAGTALVCLVLSQFKAATYPRLTSICPKIGVWGLQFLGRRTLEIYVVHLLLFKGLCLYLGLDGYGLFDLQWID